jgi:hypothetical protein
MEKNVGGYERIARIAGGTLLVLYAAMELGGVVDVVGDGTALLALLAGLAVVGSILLVTGTTQQCPINQQVGRNTYRAKGAGEGDAEEDASEEAI